VISTINGDANIGFYKDSPAAGIRQTTVPVVAFSVGEGRTFPVSTPPNPVGHSGGLGT